MIARCTKPSHKSWARYGGRGIKVCDRWFSLENFVADMGHPPDGAQIDRMNNEGNYEKANCRWASTKEQGRNRCTTRYVDYKGKRVPLAELTEGLFADRHRVPDRLKAGWSLDRALTEPVTNSRPGLSAGSKNHFAVLDEVLVQRMRQMAATGTSMAAIAEFFKVSKQRVRRVLNRETWKHVG